MSQAKPLDGKLAIVTGASRGIGAAICENLASKGCNLLMNYTSASSESTTASLAASLSSTHSITAHPIRADMGTPSGASTIVAAALTHFSHPSTSTLTIDILIQNAGVAGNRLLASATAEEFSSDFQTQYAINVLGPLLLTHACLPYLPHDGSGRIVTVSSISASISPAGQSVYAGTKAALESMTRVWARELGGRATVNSINPGPVRTDMWHAGAADWFKDQMRSFNERAPRAQVREGVDSEEIVEEAKTAGIGGRPAESAEIAGVVAMLVSPESGWCTGSVICANGGMRMSP